MTISYRTVSVDGLKVFYREAGDPKASTVLLLHGFPTSSHMFRELIPALADRYHVVAPDLPGFGFTEALDQATFKYSFDHLAEIIAYEEGSGTRLSHGRSPEWPRAVTRASQLRNLYFAN